MTQITEPHSLTSFGNGILLLKDEFGKDLRTTVITRDDDRPDDRKHPGRIVCATCGYKITERAFSVMVNGKHTHVFVNPAGYMFEIGCYSAADGCLRLGTPTFEFTWFPGFAWIYNLCGSCLAHLGWFFTSGSDSFHGLILRQVIEESPPSS